MRDAGAHAWLLAGAWLASTVALSLPGVGIGSGFAACSVLVAAVVATRVVARPRDLGSRLRGHAPLLLAGAAMVLAHALATGAAGFPREALVRCARVVAIVIFGVVVVLENRSRALARPFAWAALTFVALHVALAFLALALPSARGAFFLMREHQSLASLPRLSGLTRIPMSTGTWAILALGLASALPSPGVRRAVRGVAVVVAVATFSAATLALPAVVAASRMRPGRVRSATVIALGAVAIFAMQVHVLSVDVGGRELAISQLHRAYGQGDLGPRTTPVQEVRALGVGARFHATLYYVLAARAVRCFADHPLFGVGPRRFAYACPADTMNTYGKWSAHRPPHNDFIGYAAEMGMAGIALAALAGWTLRRAYRWAPDDAWASGGAVGLLVCACAGDVLITFPAVGFLALHLRARSSAPRASSA